MNAEPKCLEHGLKMRFRLRPQLVRIFRMLPLQSAGVDSVTGMIKVSKSGPSFAHRSKGGALMCDEIKSDGSHTLRRQGVPRLSVVDRAGSATLTLGASRQRLAFHPSIEGSPV